MDVLAFDEQYRAAVALVVGEQKASISFVQRRLKIGYNRAATFIDRMMEDGIVTEPNEIGQRAVLVKPCRPTSKGPTE